MFPHIQHGPSHLQFHRVPHGGFKCSAGKSAPQLGNPEGRSVQLNNCVLSQDVILQVGSQRQDYIVQAIS